MLLLKLWIKGRWENSVKEKTCWLMDKNDHFYMESQGMEEEWQKEKGLYEKRAMKKFGVLQTTGLQKCK